MQEYEKYPYSKSARRMNRFLYGMNHKGKWCRLANTTCQEGYCCNCHVWQRFIHK